MSFVIASWRGRQRQRIWKIWVDLCGTTCSRKPISPSYSKQETNSLFGSVPLPPISLCTFFAHPSGFGCRCCLCCARCCRMVTLVVPKCCKSMYPHSWTCLTPAMISGKVMLLTVASFAMTEIYIIAIDVSRHTLTDVSVSFFFKN